MITIRLLALTAFIVFVGFFGIIVWKVPRPDLIAVVLIGVAFVAYDLWRLLLRRGRGNS
jgi:hypothetical protein